MQKRNLLGIAVICALLFAFISCSEPVSQINTLMNKLDAPVNLKADVYDGVIITHWDPVINAKGYDVYRRDVKSNVTVKLDSGITDLYYIDWVNWDNQLTDKQDYEYTIVALSGKTNYDTAPTTILGGTEMIVQNASSKVKAKAKVPATLTVALADADVTLSTSGDFLIVSFPNKPNLAYEVGYTFGQTEAIVREFAKGNDAMGDWFYPRRVAKFPILGGENAVTVDAKFKTDYYTDKASVYKVTEKLTAAQVDLGDITGFFATRFEGKVKLEWDDVTGATEYKIYKAEISSDTAYYKVSADDAEGTGLLQGLTVIGDWAAVTAKQDLGAKWTAYDTLSKDTGYYVYAIVAKGDNASSKPAFKAVSENTIAAITGFAVNPGKDAKNKKIVWNVPDTSITYKLTYAEVKDPDGIRNATSSSYELVGDYTTIPVTGANFVKGEDPKKDLIAVVDIDLSAKIGKNLLFKLTASKNGVESDPEVAILNDEAFSTTVKFTLAADSSAKYKNAKSVYLTLTDGPTFRGIDYTFSLYRRIETTGKETVYELVTLGASATYKAKVDDDDDDSWTFEDANLDPTLKYGYKLVAKGFNNDSASKGVITGIRTSGYNSQIYNFNGNLSTTPVDVGVTDSATGHTKATIPANSVKISGNANLVGLTVTVMYDIAGGKSATTTGTIGYAKETVPKGETPQQSLYLTITKPGTATGTTVTVLGYDNALGVGTINEPLPDVTQATFGW